MIYILFGMSAAIAIILGLYARSLERYNRLLQQTNKEILEGAEAEARHIGAELNRNGLMYEPFLRRIVTASSMLPLASVRAFLQSSRPAPVFSRSSATAWAEMGAVLMY